MSDITVFAETNFRNQRRKFGIKRDDRRRHMYVVGKTGMGKSTLLENMIIADIRAGNGVAVVDPHGDLAEKILGYIPNERVNDVIYFNPADTKFPIAFNILESVGEDYKHLVAYGLVGVFKKIWADSWGPRMEYIMTNTILALLEYPGSTLLGLMRMLVDKVYRKKVVAKVTDPVVKTFWADEYANYSEKFRTEAIAPIQNKVGQFLASAIIRNIVGQSKSTIEMRDIMDKQKILIMNLAKGRIGEENSALLGAMMITKIQIATMSRVDIPEEQRKDFFLYVDEFQNFATDSFAGILSEARKYRLCLTMAHQYFEQLGDVVKAAVFGNVGTMIVFRVGATDAAELELEFAPQFLPTDIVNLKKYTFCLRLMVDGVATEPFSGIGLPPAAGATTNHEKIIKVSRERYARPQAMVEDRIIRWSGVEINRPGVTTTGTNAAATTSEDQGDDNMDWPEPTAIVDSVDDTDPEITTSTASTSSSGIQLESETSSHSPHVTAAGFIPDKISDTPVAAQPIVQVQNDLSNPAVNRPRISFVEIPVEVEDQTTDVSQTEAELEPETELEKKEDIEPEMEEEKEADRTEEQVVDEAVPFISLQALKQGTAPQVQFTASQPRPTVVTVQPNAPQSTSPQSNFPQSNLNHDEQQHHKRKRKRRRGGGGGGSGNFPNQGQSSQARPEQSPQQFKPQSAAVSSFPSPVVSSPQSIASKPVPSNDPNKVSWGDVLQ